MWPTGWVPAGWSDAFPEGASEEVYELSTRAIGALRFLGSLDAGEQRLQHLAGLALGIEQQGLQQGGSQRRVVRRQQFPGRLLPQALPDGDTRTNLHRSTGRHEATRPETDAIRLIVR